MNNFLSRNILPNLYKTEGDVAVINEFIGKNKIQSALFYPSSGADINDLFYINGKRIDEIKAYASNIFIHSDYGYSIDYGSNTFDQEIDHPNFRTFKYKFYNNDKSINVYKLKRLNTNDIKWLIFFRGYYNEEVLKHLLDNDIKIPIVYAICDGITHGMCGGFEKSIPTILYPLIANEFGIKFIITEQDWEVVKDRIDNNSNQTRNWLNNILLVTNNQNVYDLVNLNDKDLIESLYDMLHAIKERKINTKERLNCYDSRFTEHMVLKTIV